MINRFRRVLCLVLAFSIAAPVQLFANPTGGSVVDGAAAISGSGNTVTINQASNLAIINWQGFSIGSGEVTRFVQPSAQSAVLNRVTGGNPSAIYGNLSANGRVFLINPNGLMVGPTGVINAQSFIASTLDISNSAFMAGGNLSFAGNSLASLTNQGSIKALGGDVVLIAHTVQNTGSIRAANGTAALAAGSEVLLASQNGATNVYVKSGAGSGSVGVDQKGSIAAATAELLAAGGNMYAVAINNEGLVRADAIESRGGQVYLTADAGLVQNSGVLTAKSGDKGGLVQVTGGQVDLKSGSRVDVSGEAGGGTAYIGGGFQGSNPSVQNAAVTTVESGASISADALTKGDGGQVAVWSDGKTSFSGAISARGGAQGGNGGSVEVSGKNLAFHGPVDLRAPGGKDGSLLLDPFDLTIDGTPTANINNADPTNPTSINDPAKLNVTDLTNQLALSNVTVRTGAGVFGPGNINVNSAVVWNSANTLNLTAAGAIMVNSAITNAGGTGGVTMTSGFPLPIFLGANVNTSGGGSQVYNSPVSLLANATLTSGGAITFNQNVSGASNLTTSSVGNTNFTAGFNGLTSANITAGGNINMTGGTYTTGSQGFHGAVVAVTPVVFTSDAGGITFDNGVAAGANAFGANAGAGNLSITGNVAAGSISLGGNNVTWNNLLGGADITVTALNAVNVNGAVTGSGNVLMASGAGGIKVNANVTTTGVASQEYNGAVTLLADKALNSAGTLKFDSTLDGARTLIATSGGATTFTGAVGAGAALTGLTVNSGGGINVGGNVTTGAGTQEYNGAVTLTAASAMTSGGALKFDSTVNGAKALTTNSVGATTFSGAVGGVAALTALDVTGSAINLGGGVDTTGGAGVQEYHNAVTLTGDATLKSGGALKIDSTVNGAKALTTNSVGATTFSGAVGGVAALTALDVTGSAINLGGSVDTTGGAGVQEYHNALTLTGDATLKSGGVLKLDSTVNGAKALTTNSVGATTFSGAVGGVAALTALDVTGSAINLGGSVDTTGGAGVQEYHNAVTLTGDATLKSGGALKIDSTVNGAKALTTNSVGATTFSGAVGGAAALSSLDATAGGNININGGAVTTNGQQNYRSAMTLGANDTFTTGGGALTFGGAVTGGANSLTAAAGAGDVAWNGNIAATGITITGRDLLMNGNLTANGASNVILTDSRSFNNAAGKTITAAGGHYELFSQTPASDVLGGLVFTALAGTSASHPVCTGNCLYYPASIAPPSTSLLTPVQKINLINPVNTGSNAATSGTTAGGGSTAAVKKLSPTAQAAADNLAKAKAAAQASAKAAAQAKATASADEKTSLQAGAAATSESGGQPSIPQDRSETIKKIGDAYGTLVGSIFVAFGNIGNKTVSDKDKAALDAGTAGAKYLASIYDPPITNDPLTSEDMTKITNDPKVKASIQVLMDENTASKTAEAKATADKAAADADKAAQAAADKAKASADALKDALAAAADDPNSLPKAVAAAAAQRQANLDKSAARKAVADAAGAHAKAADADGTDAAAQSKVEVSKAQATELLSGEAAKKADQTAKDKGTAAFAAAIGAGISSIVSSAVSKTTEESPAQKQVAEAEAAVKKDVADKETASAAASAKAAGAQKEVAKVTQALADVQANIVGDAEAPVKAGIIAQMKSLRAQAELMWSEVNNDDVDGLRSGPNRNSWGVTVGNMKDDVFKAADISGTQDIATMEQYLEKTKAAMQKLIDFESGHNSSANINERLTTAKMALDPDALLVVNDNAVDQKAKDVEADSVKMTAKAQALQDQAKKAQDDADAAQKLADDAATAAKNATDGESDALIAAAAAASKKAAEQQATAKNMSAAAKDAQDKAIQAAADSTAANDVAKKADADSAAAKVAVAKAQAVKAKADEAYRQETIVAAKAAVQARADYAQQTADDLQAAKSAADSAEAFAVMAAQKTKDDAAAIPVTAKRAADDAKVMEAAKTKYKEDIATAAKDLTIANAAVAKANKIGEALSKARGKQFSARMSAIKDMAPKDPLEMGLNAIGSLASGKSVGETASDVTGVKKLMNGGKTDEEVDANESVEQLQADYDAQIEKVNELSKKLDEANNTASASVDAYNAVAKTWSLSDQAARQAVLNKENDDLNAPIFASNALAARDYAKQMQVVANQAATDSAKDKP